MAERLQKRRAAVRRQLLKRWLMTQERLATPARLGAGRAVHKVPIVVATVHLVVAVAEIADVM